MNHLLRSLAPITPSGWDLVDQEAKEHLTASLAARKLVDFSGPEGWEHSATNLGRAAPITQAPAEGVVARARRVLALVELRAAFSVSREELRDNDRGAQDVDLDDLDEAAKQLALAENVAVFHGWPEAGIDGIIEASPHSQIPRGKSVETYPRRVAKGVELLLRSGVSGPYGLALSPDEYTTVIETAEHGGYPLFDHLRKILGGPIVWAPGVRGAVLLSLRGGDFLFDAGQDIAVGYVGHDAQAVHLYLEESFSFRVVTPEAAVALGA
ncbi:MAG: family 1 encapsulin nanocompartment shell protein [Solirubrobacteraceae bacterium]